MKNSLNMVIVIFVFIVLGCSCPKLEDIQKKVEESSKKTSNSDTAANSATKAAKEVESADDSVVNMEKYSQIENGMSYKQVKSIIGKEGIETMSSGEGKYKVTSYKWEGEGFAFLSVVLTGDKVISKYQANLK
jgi:hypothetical protein